MFKKIEAYVKENLIEVIFELALVILLMILNIIIGFIALVIFVSLHIRFLQDFEDQTTLMQKNFENIEETIDSLTKQAVFKMPFPMVIINQDGEINWYNSKFIKMLEIDGEPENNILDAISSLNLNEILSAGDEPLKILYRDNYYQVYVNKVKSKDSKDREMLLLYWINRTDLKEAKDTIDKEKIATILLYIDNLDEVKSSVEDSARATITGNVETEIINYFNAYEATVRKYDDDRYLIIANNENLQKIIQKKFDILDRVRDLKVQSIIPLTLSIAATTDGETPLKQYEIARNTMDIALGRGGDQAVLRRGHNYEYFGGKSKAVEKTTKVKARVVGGALRSLIDDASNVVIMPHKNADMDAIGSAIGVVKLVRMRGKTAYIALNSVNMSIRNIMARLKEEKSLNGVVRTEAELSSLIDDKTLLIVVDHHKKSISEAPDLVDQIRDRVVIDHHRRSGEFIESTELVFLEPYASSTAELVTELFTYMTDNVVLSKFEAEALLAGITVDTKNFTVQTGVRTFEAASMLRRFGADPEVVKKYFKEDYMVIKNRADIVRQSEIFMDDTIIGILEDKVDNSILIAAQAADEMLSINGMKASFVAVKISNNETHVSARSLGEISVQLIMEKLGGGGHLNQAATRIDLSVDLAVEELKRKIKEYKDEEKESKKEEGVK
ncbi:DHH family phosphoesterase [Fenollaria massiliensis]|uniref:DHH family phosphoesterase n=1 Tax=Fenollaria massiliensis TaxID=938288 RepID=UPI000360D4C4|nr:DHH family phosphoesterase [Fenollaria massiliensis]